MASVSNQTVLPSSQISELHILDPDEEQDATLSSPDSSDNDQSRSFCKPSPTKHEPSYSVIGVSIGRAQTRLASPSTPAAEKAQAIKDGGGYFSLPQTLVEASESPLPDQIPEGEEEEVNEPPLSEEVQQGDKLAVPIVTAPKSGHSLERPATLRKSSSAGSLSLHPALSIASSLGDDSRFVNVRGQINTRIKAVRDTFHDSSFRLPSLPSFSSLTVLPSVNLPSLPNLPKLPSLLKDKNRSHHSNSSSSNTTVDSLRYRLRRNTHHAGQKPPRADESNHYANAKPSAGPNNSSYLTKAISQLSGDVVILGGYRGSHLKTVEKPHGRRIWVPPFSAALNITKVKLEVGLEDEDEEKMPDTIVPDGMLTHIGPIDVSRRLIKRLRSSKNALQGKLRIHEWSYDWRLSPGRLSQQLVYFLETLPDNRVDVYSNPQTRKGALVIAHSLGGLITRHAVNLRPELFSGLVYAGVPQHCVNILGPLRNGDEVLKNSKILTAQVNFSVRTSFALLPLEGICFSDIDTGQESHVDFFNVDHWIKYRFSSVIDPPLPPLPPAKPSSMMSSMIDNLPFIGRRSSTMFKKSGESVDERAAEATGSVPSMANSRSNYTTQSQSSPRNSSQALNSPSASSSSSSPFSAMASSFSSLSNSIPSLASLRQSAGFVYSPTSASSQANPTATSAASYSKGMSSATNTATSNSSAGNINGNGNNTANTAPIPRDQAIAYLTRTLAAAAAFKRALAHDPHLSNTNQYPPMSVIYGKAEPTVCGARVRDIHGGSTCTPSTSTAEPTTFPSYSSSSPSSSSPNEYTGGIARADAYDNLVFASGDGVVLARAAMLPDGYRAAKGGVVGTERGHISLLGDLEAVGRCLVAVLRERAKGVGLGPGYSNEQQQQRHHGAR